MSAHASAAAPTFSRFDEDMMRRALELAALGRYSTPPNPCVGCVLVQGERIVGEGWHRKSGEAHAERLALDAAGDAAPGATAYVTLEPHSYHSRMPPCTDALINAGVRRVVCSTLDSNPRVSGNGVAQLREAGLEVSIGLLEAEAHALIRGFAQRMRTGMPRVIVKIGASLDGRIALANGASRWITSEASRADVQRLRAQSSAIITGIGTVLADDPLLTVRAPDIDLAGRVPSRIVLDSNLRMPPDARMLSERGETIVFTSVAAPDRLQRLREKAVVESVSSDAGLNLTEVLRRLGERFCNDVLVEAGPTLSGRFIEAGLVDQLIVYVAPKLLGNDARPMARLPLLTDLERAPQFKLVATERLDDDVKLVYEQRSWS